MSAVVRNLKEIEERIAAAARRAGRDPDSVRLVAVSKKISTDHMQEAVQAGQRRFGENYLQEALDKIPLFDSTVKWHFIGHLQSNKTKQAAQSFDVVETIDRLKIAAALNEQCRRLERKMTVLIQVNVGREGQKSGILPEQVEPLAREIKKMDNLRLTGFMTMPPYYDNPEKVRPYFRELRMLGQKFVNLGILGEEFPLELSMGMSGDFEVAIEEGATLVRVGTAIFGERDTKSKAL